MNASSFTNAESVRPFTTSVDRSCARSPGAFRCPGRGAAVLLYAAGLLVSLLGIGGAPRAAAQAADLCVENGGTAECRGPEVGNWDYVATSAPYNGTGHFATESAALSDLEAVVVASKKACTSTIYFAGFLPLPGGTSGSGSRNVGDPAVVQQSTGDYWSQSWTLGTEYNQRLWTVRVKGIAATNANPPCATGYSSGSVQLVRDREVACPMGFGANNVTAPTGRYCYRAANAAPSPRPKTLGPCKDCDLMIGNPVNVGTGNKYHEETDYRGSGPFPLEYTRRYNSLAFGAFQAPTLGPWFHLGTPNWRGTYSRAVQFGEHNLYPGADVYRQDGRIIRFKLTGGQFVPDADVNDKLTMQTDASGNITGWTLVTEADETETYDATGRLTQIRNRAGLAHNIAYDGGGRIATVTHTFGQQMTFTYGTSNRLVRIDLPGGGSINYTNGGPGGNLSQVQNADGTTRQYHYPASSNIRQLTGITDESLVRFSTYTYENSTTGRVLTEEWAGSVNRWTYAYTSTSRTTFVDPLTVSRTFDYTKVFTVPRGTALSSLCPTCGNAAKAKTFDANGNVTSRKDFRNELTCYAYDTTRNLETVRVEGFDSTVTSCPTNLASYTPTSGTRQRKISTTWHATYRLPTLITEAARSTAFTYDTAGNLLTRTVTDLATSATRVWTNTYDSYGRVLTADGPRTDVNDTTTYTYYTCTTGSECGQVATVTNPLGQVTTYNTYNVHGQPLTITDPNGVVTTLTYDARQRLTSRTVGGETTTLEYWPTGRLKKTILPDTSFLLYTFDNAQRLIRVEDNTGNRTEYTLDNLGNRTAENTYDPTNSLRRTRSRVFNTLSQLWKDVPAAGTTAVTTVYGYDANGNAQTINAPLARNTTNAYDELDRLKQITDPGAGNTFLGYDAQDNLVSVTDPKGLVTSYQYNGFGDLTQQTSPDTGVTSQTYDSGGNVLTRTDARAAVATSTYDALNRLASVAYGDQTIVFGYDAGTNGKGRLTSASDSQHSLAWSYDAQGRVIGKGQTVGAVTQSVGYGYSSGRLASMTLPSGQVVTYGYGADGRVTSLAVGGNTVLSGVLYEPFGPARQWTWGNSTLSARTYDTDYKVAQIDSAGLKTYGYDDAFRITGITDTVNGANSWTYGYDALDRLTSATKTGLTQGWTYDANGNRQTETGATPSTYSYAASPASNRLASTSGALARTYGYDAAGNTASYAGATFTYNNHGRMASASYSGGTATYVYNALGQRVKRVGPSGTTLYMYDEVGHLVGEYDGAGALIQETVWLGDTPVATLRPNGASGVDVFYVHVDHLNTPRVVTQPSNNAERWRWDSDAFGTNPPNEDPSSAGVFKYNLRFPGQVYDGLAGLYYNYFRDYDAATGRYVEPDPLGMVDGPSIYAYVGSRPIIAVDPSGLVLHELARPIVEYLFPMPWSQERCAELLQKIRNLNLDIERRLAVIKRNPGELPQFGPGNNAATVQGHHREVKRLDQHRRKAERDYDRHCNNNCPPGSPATVPDSNELTTATGGAIGTLIVVGGALILL